MTCWYCRCPVDFDPGRSFFSGEFDTHIHIECVPAGGDDTETRLIRAERDEHIVFLNRLKGRGGALE